MIRLVLLTACSLAALPISPVRADAPSIERVEFGFGGTYKPAESTPLVVELGSSEADPGLTVETLTSDADGCTVIQPLTIERNGSPIVQGVIQAGRLGSDLAVRVKNADGVVVAERRLRSEHSDGADVLRDALPKGTRLWATAGAFYQSDGDARRAAVPVPDGVVAAPLPEPVPADDDAYAAVDLLFIRGDFRPNAEQADAIRRWVADGGRLAVALGGHTEAFREGPFADWIPVNVGPAVQLRDLAPLEQFAGADRRLPSRVSRRVRAAQFSDAAEELAVGVDGPLIVRSPYGFGTVTLFAIDLDDFPFSTWAGTPNLIRKSLIAGEPSARETRQVRVSGVSDIATQLARAEDAFPEVERPTVGFVLLLLLVYAAVIGPLDYLLVHRVLRRPALTWLTLPALVLAGSWWLHGASADANDAGSRFNETTLLDIDAETSVTRIRSTVTLYASDSTATDLEVSPADNWNGATANDVPHLAWSAPPEATFGGVFRDASGGLFHPEYRLSADGKSATADSVPQLVWSSRRFRASWQTQAANLVEADLISRGVGSLEGRVTHRLPGQLTNFIVVFGNRLYRNPHEPVWHPGEPLDLASPALERLDLDSFLRNRITTRVDRKPGDSGAEFLVTDTTYDPLNTELDEIIRQLTFFEASGGTQYSGITNDVLQSQDLTHLLRMGRAIVLAELDSSNASPIEVSVEGESVGAFTPARRTTFVRMVLPVEQGDASIPVELPRADGGPSE